jgi:hypothetical protein
VSDDCAVTNVPGRADDLVCEMVVTRQDSETSCCRHQISDSTEDGKYIDELGRY